MAEGAAAVIGGRVAQAAAPATIVEIDTPHGPARAHLEAAESPLAALVLGHGAGGGIAAPDLVAARRAALAATDLDPVFRARPAIHRFPGSMAKRVHDLAVYIRDHYGGDASRVWTDAQGSEALRANLAALPGFGEMKIKALGSVLAKRFDVAVADGLVPNHPTLGDVDSAEALEEYQAKKRAYKSARRQAEAQRKA